MDSFEMLFFLSLFVCFWIFPRSLIRSITDYEKFKYLLCNPFCNSPHFASIPCEM
ncbi:hypothetical protein K443DRAFT_680161 [Laccaria amethystina LaAM-08-1]|uniref:Uncharacterized protein n=1 Tax=Laccaria amethystina LaAM-08-1 TaxID=1095629 RepID=A0A0C9X281_9AGAR|nr:hypothetical protein K443DRAFT_680161 [Laccaria amethystina LaAM-08-1]